VFASTVHGYEGSGRGFTLKFNQTLDRLTPGWQSIKLEHAIRWNDADPLEQFTFQALLLDAEAAKIAQPGEVTTDHCQLAKINRDVLVDEPPLLRQIFGLLVNAHYRTSPADLRNLLDGPNLDLFVLRHKDTVVATALVAYEGGFEPELAFEICAGRRRPRGHLLAQTLTAHCGLLDAATRQCARIMRIAVHPALQNRGLGSHLLQQIVQRLGAAGCQLAGSSFGGTAELVHFWIKNGFHPVRCGTSRGTTSGTHSVVVLAPLDEDNTALYNTARLRFLDQLPHMLKDALSDMEPDLASALLQQPDITVADRGISGTPEAGLDQQDWQDLVMFAFALRSYDITVAPAWKLANTAIRQNSFTTLLTAEDQQAITLKLFEHRGWSEVAELLQLNGKRAVVDILRRAFRTLIQHHGNEFTGNLVRRLRDRR
jgi:tRNA(Met) cytidine acetyltransferase